MTIAKTIHLLGIDMETLVAVLQECIHHRSCRRLDTKCYLIWSHAGLLAQPIYQLLQSRSAMHCLAFGHLVAFPVQYTNRVLFSGPIDTHEKQKGLAHRLSSVRIVSACRGKRHPCTGARRRKLPTGLSPRATRRGAAPHQAFTFDAGIGWALPASSRAAGLITQINSLAQRVQGSAPLLCKLTITPVPDLTNVARISLFCTWLFIFCF